MTSTNPVIDTIHGHRSIRRYEPGPVPDADIHAAVRAGQAASTSSAVQAYSLIRVRDPERRAALVDLTGGQPYVAACGAFFAVCGDTRRHRLVVARSGRTYDAQLEAFLLGVIDATLFAQNLALAFESMGYGICYIGGLRSRIADVDRLLGIPEGIYPLYGLCVGTPAEAPSERPRLPVEAILHEEAYADDAAVLAQIDAYDVQYRAYLTERGAKSLASWSERMAEKFSVVARGDLGDYYRRKGADFE